MAAPRTPGVRPKREEDDSGGSWPHEDRHESTKSRPGRTTRTRGSRRIPTSRARLSSVPRRRRNRTERIILTSWPHMTATRPDQMQRGVRLVRRPHQAAQGRGGLAWRNWPSGPSPGSYWPQAPCHFLFFSFLFLFPFHFQFKSAPNSNSNVLWQILSIDYIMSWQVIIWGYIYIYYLCFYFT
jgi:hypothetical protein